MEAHGIYSPILPRAGADQQGSHRQKDSSISALVSTVVPVFAIFCVLILVFLLLRKQFERVYRPRTHKTLLRDGERSPQHSSGLFGWIKQYSELPDDFVLGHSSLDNYLWMRFFKMLMVMCGVGVLITCPILMPVYATAGGGEEGLGILSFANVADNPIRYYATCFVTWAYLGFVMLFITRETIYYINIRQAYNMSPFNTSRISARSVIFTDVPEKYTHDDEIRRVFPDVLSVWRCYNPEELQDLVDERMDNINKLEGAECKMIGAHVKNHSKTSASDEISLRQNNGSLEHGRHVDVDPKTRPTHKTKFLIGKKVDTIEHCRSEIRRLNDEITRHQHSFYQRKEKPESAVIVEFATVRAAQAAYQQTAHSKPFHFTPKAIGMTPDTVLWKNIIKPWWSVKLMSAAATAFVTFLCIFWTIPVAAIGFISNIDKLIELLPFLSFINSVPEKVRGVITGLLPVVLLAILMKLVPIICMLMAKKFEPTLAKANLKVQSWYFAFQVIQVFLITTFSSGAAAVINEIKKDPTSAPNLLAKNLPKASGFYVSYFILEGLMLSALQLISIAPLAMAILGKVLDKTPRKKMNRYLSMASINWGAMFPVVTNLGVIALSYSTIAPLVLIFATLCFGLLYLAFRYNALFTLGLGADTHGACYARALQQLTVGVYLSEFCLIGLFAIGSGNSLLALGPLVLMIVFFIATILFHLQMRSALSKLADTLPNTLLCEETQPRITGDAETKGSTHVRYPGQENGMDRMSSERTAAYQVPNGDNPPERPTGAGGFIQKAMHPWKYDSPAALSRQVLSPHLANPIPPYSEEEHLTAYMHPAISAECSPVWIAADAEGLSRQEIMDSKQSDVVMTDKHAWFNKKGKVEWEAEALTDAPIWEGRPIY